MKFELEAKKSLGQNFLKNTTIIKKMVEACSDIVKKHKQQHKTEVSVLEIGPGTGALTEYLLGTGLKIHAIETDDRAIPVLNEKFNKHIKDKTLTLIHADIREYDVIKTESPYIIVANIPYYLTGYITRKFLESKNQPIAMIIMVQKEVALRVLDKKGSLASLGINTYGKARILTHVSKGNFVPSPKVDSSILIIEDIQRKIFDTEDQEKKYWEFAKKAFGNKRKQLGGTILKGIKDGPLTIYLKKRPEDLQTSDWLFITKNISTNIYTDI